MVVSPANPVFEDVKHLACSYLHMSPESLTSGIFELVCVVARGEGEKPRVVRRGNSNSSAPATALRGQQAKPLLRVRA